jgi:hypothetical protein
MKGYQNRYYVRMREIEYTAYLINHVTLGGEYGDKGISAPRIDMTWDFKGYPVNKDNEPPGHDGSAEKPEPDLDWRGDQPWRRSPEKIYSDLRRRFWLTNVMLPHVLAVVLGAALFIAAALHTPALEQLHL